MGEVGGAGDAHFQGVPKVSKRDGPLGRWNWASMMLAFQQAQRFDSDLEPRAVNVIEGEESNEGDERLT